MRDDTRVKIALVQEYKFIQLWAKQICQKIKVKAHKSEREIRYKSSKILKLIKIKLANSP